MERLTKELWDGCTIEEFSHFVELDGVESKTVGNGWAHPVVVGKSIDRLAAYEDTEHTPDDLQMMIHAYNAMEIELTAYRNTELSPEQIQAQQQEIDRLKYTLIGVMHSVDKWFDEVDESIDEVNRAAQAREIALQAIEYYEEKNEDLGGLIMQMEDALKKAKKAIFYLSGSAESFNGPKIIKDAKQAISALLGGAEDSGCNANQSDG